jgi:putative oxidoreductase
MTRTTSSIEAQQPPVTSIAAVPRAPSTRDATAYLVPLGRLLFAAIFLQALPGHFMPETISYAAQKGVPLAALAVPLSGVVAFAGGLSVVLGFRARVGAWLLVLFLVPVTFTMHDFWNVTDPTMGGLELAMFMKNTGLVGAALLVAHFGGGPSSLDERRR